MGNIRLLKSLLKMSITFRIKNEYRFMLTFGPDRLKLENAENRRVSGDGEQVPEEKE